MTGKYKPLTNFLASIDRSDWPASFSDVERILGFSLPSSARKWQAWWSNSQSHSQANAWIEAGWEIRKVDFDKESVVFVRGSSSSRVSRARTLSTRRGDEKKLPTGPSSVGFSSVTHLLDYVFIHADVIEPDRGDDGSPLEFMPQSRYELAETTRLNRYGEGPFCRFTVKGLPTTSGVYALTVDGVVAYVGKADNLTQRWGPQGYGNISPRNCYVGGQSTNCKVNNYILLCTREDRRTDLWIHETSDAGSVEAKVIRELDPPWNGQMPSTR